MKKSFLTQALEPLLKLPAEPPELPAHTRSSSRVFRAAEAFLTYRYVSLVVGSALGALSLLVGLLATAASREWLAFGIVAAVSAFVFAQFVVSFAITRLDWELRYYVVTDRALRIREGAWIMRELTLTFLNVQNVTIEQGPIERLFGIANVVVSTAGGGAASASEKGSTGGHRAVVRGVTNAPEIRDLIRTRLEAARRDAGLGDFDDAHPHPTPPLVLDGQLELLRQIRAETAALAQVANQRAARP